MTGVNHFLCVPSFSPDAGGRKGEETGRDIQFLHLLVLIFLLWTYFLGDDGGSVEGRAARHLIWRSSL